MHAVRVPVHGLPAARRNACAVVILVLWSLFAADHPVRWRLTGRRLGLVRTHWLDTLVLLVPLVRPLRMVRVHTAVQSCWASPARSPSTSRNTRLPAPRSVPSQTPCGGSARR